MKFKGAIREATTLLSGSVVAQAITLVAYFVLLRIYSAADYGLFSIFYSYIEIIVIASTCKYELAIVPATSDREATAIARHALRLNTIVSVALLTLLTVLTLTDMLPGKFARLGHLALLIAPMVYLCGTSRVYGELYNRYHRYRTIAASDVTGAASGATLKTLFGLLGMHTAGMPLGTVLGQAAANLVYRLSLNKVKGEGLKVKEADESHDHVSHLSINQPPLNKNTFHISSYKNFPLYTAPKDILNSLSANLPFIWLALYFNNTSVGLFGLAMTFIIKPTQMLCASFERVLNARSAEAVHDNRKLMPMLRRYLLPATLSAIGGAVCLWFISPYLFGLLFGGRWTGCAPYARLLLPWAVANIVSLPLMYMPNIFGTQRIELIINIVRLLLRVAAIAVGIATASFMLAVGLFSAASTVIALVLLIWYLYQARRHDRQVQP